MLIVTPSSGGWTSLRTGNGLNGDSYVMNGKFYVIIAEMLAAERQCVIVCDIRFCYEMDDSNGHSSHEYFCFFVITDNLFIINREFLSGGRAFDEESYLTYIAYAHIRNSSVRARPVDCKIIFS